MAKIELVDARHPNAAPNRFRSIKETQEFLKQAAAEFENLPGLRAAWKKAQKEKGQKPLPPDRIVLADLAKLLMDGRLRTTRELTASGKPAAGGGEVSDSPNPAPLVPRSPRTSEPPLMIRPRPDPVANSVPPPVTDIAKQVAALKEAAKSGTPFCEQCEQARE